jgi:acetolactate synthase II small subunit
MASELTIRMRPSEGALLRVLGTIERRGFALHDMQTRDISDGIELTLRIDADARPVEVLVRQLNRLYDVREAWLDSERDGYTSECIQQTFGVPGMVPA